jgi:hypothetical protein
MSEFKVTVSRPDREGVRAVHYGKTLIGTIEDRNGKYVSKPVLKARGHTTTMYGHRTIAAARLRMERIAEAALKPTEWVVYEGHENPTLSNMFVMIEGPYTVHLRTADEQEARAKYRELRRTKKRGQYIGLTAEFESLA